MKKDEFLSVLRASLEGKIDNGTLTSQLDFYSEYISQNALDGKTEEDVIEEIGDPRLIAKTIISSEHAGRQDDFSYRYQDSDINQGVYSDETYEEPRRAKWYNKWMYMGGCLASIIIFLIILFFFIKMLFYAVMPFLFIGIIGFVIYSIFKQS